MPNWAIFWELICTVLLTVCYYHVSYTFQSESTIYSCLNAKELLARNRRDIWSLSDRNGIRTHNHLVRQRILNRLVKQAKWLSSVVSTYLCGAFENTNTDKMFTVSSLQALIRTCLPFSQTGQMIELCCEYLSVRCFWKYKHV